MTLSLVLPSASRWRHWAIFFARRLSALDFRDQSERVAQRAALRSIKANPEANCARLASLNAGNFHCMALRKCGTDTIVSAKSGQYHEQRDGRPELEPDHPRDALGRDIARQGVFHQRGRALEQGAEHPRQSGKEQRPQ